MSETATNETQTPSLQVLCPTVYERLSRPTAYDRKMLIEAPSACLPETEELIRNVHETLNPESPFVVVDIKTILETQSDELLRDVIYREALSQLGQPNAEESTWPLDNFQRACKAFMEQTKDKDPRGKGYRVGLFITNIDAATRGMTSQEAHTFYLTTFRVRLEGFNIYGHVESFREAQTSSAINDVVPITEN